MGKDKEYLTVLESTNNLYQKSFVHKLFFNDVMKFPIDDNMNFDTNENLTITCFPSNKHGYPMEMFKDVKYL